MVMMAQKVAHIDGIADFCKLVESDDLLEVIEECVSRGGVGEVCDSRSAWPRHDGSEKDTEEDGATNAVHHKEKGEDTAIVT